MGFNSGFKGLNGIKHKVILYQTTTAQNAVRFVSKVRKASAEVILPSFYFPQ